MFKNILLAIDLSDISLIAAEKAKSFADTYGSKLTIVHIIEPIPAYGYPGIGHLESPVIDQAKAKLAEIAQSIHIPKENQRVEFGSVKGKINELTKDLDIDLIVIGSHGQSGWSFILGSNASAIVNSAECDVFVVRNVKETKSGT